MGGHIVGAGAAHAPYGPIGQTIRQCRIPGNSRTAVVDIQGKGGGGAHLHGGRTALFQGEHIGTDDGHVGSRVRPPGRLGRGTVVALVVGIVGGIVEREAADIGHRILQHDRDVQDDLFTGRDVDANGRIFDHDIGGCTGIDRGPRL